MKQVLITSFLLTAATTILSQEVLRLKNGSTIVVQNGVELTLQGGVTLENGSLLINNGTTRLKNNVVANQSNWADNSVIGALGGTGLVVFNSNLSHQYNGSTHFYNVQINTGGITTNNHFTVDNQLNLIKGKINTGANYVFLGNNSAASLLNDASNSGYINSWINGNFRRLITNNISTYDFPVGNSSRCDLLQFINNNISGTSYLTASFGPKPGTDAGLNVIENGSVYTSVNNGGVWWLIPNAAPSAGNYALQLYFNGFTNLTDNQFGILRRQDASTNAADWKIPPGSIREPFNGPGRKVSDGFARRINISNFSQFGIGTLSTVPCDNCAVVCTYTQGFYGNQNGKACYSGTNTLLSSTQLMLNAFGASTSQVFGNESNKRFFTLYKTDISNGNIFKMLPGSGNSQPLGLDNLLPYEGAYYSNQSTWYLVPILTTGAGKGKINNQLLSQMIALWFNLRTSASLATVDLSNDTLVTIAQTNCGSGIPTGPALKFGLPHNVIVYLNGSNGYTHDVSGLFRLANDILGGSNSSIPALDAQNAVARINEAFDGCRILIGTISYSQEAALMTTILPPKQKLLSQTQQLDVLAFPNPFQKQFSLNITSPISGGTSIELFSANGSKIHQQTNYVQANSSTIIPIAGHYTGIIIYRVTIDKYQASGIVVGPN